MFRPKIAVPGRFTESASALRYRGLVSARLLIEGLWRAGGDPLTLLPTTGAGALDWEQRLRGFDAVLLPGGGDVMPSRFGLSNDHPALYDMSEVQDDTDFSLARYALDHGIPLLAICRGLHVLNAALGGTLIVDMPTNHRHHVHEVALADPADHLGFGTASVTCSCYHHQAIDRVADRVSVLGRSHDGWVEAVAVDAPAWAAGVQWHPEDTFDADPVQLRPLQRLVAEARAHAAR